MISYQEVPVVFGHTPIRRRIGNCLENFEYRVIKYFNPRIEDFTAFLRFICRNRINNLICTSAAGKLLWHAELPKDTMPDYFVEVRLDGDSIKANTFSCHFVTLDRKTGKILDSVFTK